MSDTYPQIFSAGSDSGCCNFGKVSPDLHRLNGHASRGRTVGTVDTEWFRRKLGDANLSAAKAGEMIGTNRSTFNRLLNGQRQWTAEVAAEVATVLGVPLDEVVQRVGITLPRQSRAGVPIVGTVGENGTVGPRKGTQTAKVDRPGEALPKNLAAVRVEAPGAVNDGWTCFYEPVTKLSPDAIGRLAVVELRNMGGKYLGVLKRGYSAGRWNLWHLSGEILAEGVEIGWAAPVLWILA
jgi:hypothetical protein